MVQEELKWFSTITEINQRAPRKKKKSKEKRGEGGGGRKSKREKKERGTGLNLSFIEGIDPKPPYYTGGGEDGTANTRKWPDR